MKLNNTGLGSAVIGGGGEGNSVPVTPKETKPLPKPVESKDPNLTVVKPKQASPKKVKRGSPKSNIKQPRASSPRISKSPSKRTVAQDVPMVPSTPPANVPMLALPINLDPPPQPILPG